MLPDELIELILMSGSFNDIDKLRQVSSLVPSDREFVNYLLKNLLYYKLAWFGENKYTFHRRNSIVPTK